MANNQINIDQLISRLENKAEQFVTAAIGVGSAEAMRLTPREYGNLANSQFTTVNKYQDKIVGRVGYSVYYAKYLNGLPGYRTPTWNPRPINQKQGPSTNMNAEPGFLNKGFESERSKNEIENLARQIFQI